MLIALLACTPGSVIIEQGEKPGVDDTGTVPDDTGTIETGETGDTGTTPEPAPVCGHLSGITADGTRWEYQPINETPQYEMTRVATVTEMDGAIVRLLDETTYVSTAGPDYTYVWSYEYVYNCDDEGVWLLGQTTHYLTDYDGNETESQTQLELDSPALIYPLEASLGSSWDSVYDGRQISNGYESPYRMTYNITVIGDELVTVPYGEVSAFRLMSEVNGYPYQTWYVGQELGVVQDTSWMLEDYAP